MERPKLDPGREVNVPAIDADQATLDAILNIAYFWAGVVAVLVIVIAGFFFVTANGNAQTIERAKNAVLGGVIGLVVVSLAFFITNIALGAL